MKKYLRKPLLMIVTMLFGGVIHAQDLVVSLTNGNTETFAVSDITSIKFVATDMILNESNGTVNTWTIDDIDNYSFDGVAITDSEANLLVENATVYPNPATDKVNIQFNSNQMQQIQVEIIDAAGKLIYKVFQGQHTDESSFVWTPQSQGNAGTGNYFCKITTENKVITQPIIIQ
jgi:NADH dehydrogenase/NADH:ubiquinone oxidoreductase subunit G